MIILGIETSCDETAASVVEGRGDKVEVLSNVVSSQIEIHKKYGGVVPEVAAREHVLNILPVINETLEKAGINPLNPPLKGGQKSEILHVKEGREVNFDSNIRYKKIDAIAVTTGPGLITSLQVGVETAKTLAYAWGVPVVALNHIEGHIYANWLQPISEVKSNIKFPALVLTVSGGHTMLVLMLGHGEYKLIGETRDDAAGEAFDKAGQMLGLGYPGGPAVAEAASKVKSIELKVKSLPRPMIRDKNYDFSFSGLKTALLYELRKDKSWKKKIPEYAAEFQVAVTDVLVHKTVKAAKALNCKTIMLAGGVAANQVLRAKLEKAVKENLVGAELIVPDLKYCTDNAAMIAAAGYFHAQREDFTPWQKLRTEANLEL